MASMLAIASALWAPIAKPPDVSSPPAGASVVLEGVGVDGAAAGADAVTAGAAGAAGVEATGCAGVAGGAAAAAEAAGFG